MNKHKAERFEEALERMGEAEATDPQMEAMLGTAQLVSLLGTEPPDPPKGLNPSRQRLLTEAAKMREAGVKPGSRWAGVSPSWKLATALGMVLIFVLTLSGVNQAAAASLPGELLYGVKLTTEKVQLALTSDPQEVSELRLTLADRRMDEITTLVAEGNPVDLEMATRVEEELLMALESAAGLADPEAVLALEALTTSIQNRQETMTRAMTGAEAEAARQVLRVMERVRTEAHVGQLDPGGLRDRIREGMPPAPVETETLTPPPDENPPGTKEPQGPKPTDKPPTKPAPTHTPPRDGNGPGEPPATKPPDPQPTQKPPNEGPGEPPSTPHSTPKRTPPPADPPGDPPGDPPEKPDKPTPDSPKPGSPSQSPKP